MLWCFRAGAHCGCEGVQLPPAGGHTVHPGLRPGRPQPHGGLPRPRGHSEKCLARGRDTARARGLVSEIIMINSTQLFSDLTNAPGVGPWMARGRK